MRGGNHKNYLPEESEKSGGGNPGLTRKKLGDACIFIAVQAEADGGKKPRDERRLWVQE